MIHEVSQVIWVETPHGTGQALFLIDYGPHENTVWIIALQKNGKVKHYNSNQISLIPNHTFNLAVEDQLPN